MTLLKRLILPALFLAVAAAAVYWFTRPEEVKGPPEKPKPASGPVAIDAWIATPSPLEGQLEVNGTLVAPAFAELRPEVAGRITTLTLPEGREVREGTLIAQLFDDDLRAQYRKTEAQLNIARQTVKRLSSLLEVKGVNQQEYDQALAQMQSLEADLDFVKAQLRKTQILAPFTGTLGLRQVSLGAYITPQTIVTTIRQTNALFVDFNVPEVEASLIKRGSTVEVEVDGVGKRRATIEAFESQIDATSRNLRVRAIIREGVAGLQPGAFARVYLPRATNTNAYLLPSGAFIPDTRDKKVFVVRGGKAKPQVVRTGQRLRDRVEVLEGLQTGDTVAVSGILYLRPDAPVQVRLTAPQ
jgi:membrane fusion protein (multidrug efflux system)